MTATSNGARRAGVLAGRVGGVAGSLAGGQLLIGLTYVVAARSMPPEGLGTVATCVAISMIAATVFDMGLGNYLVRELAAGRTDAADARAVVRAKRRFVPLLLVPVAVVCVLIMPTLVDGLVLGALGWLCWEAQTANSLLRARERFTVAATTQVTGRAVGLGGTVALVLLSRPELALAVGLTAGFAVEALLDRVALGHPGRGDTTARTLATAQRRSTSFGFVALSSTGQQLDTPLVSLGGGLAAGGIYAGAGRLLGPLLFLSYALALVGAPWLARAAHDPVALAKEERRIGRFALLLALGPVAAAVVGPIVIPWILGPQYADSGTVFAILAIGGALSTMSQGTVVVLQNRGAERAVSSAVAIGLVLGLVTTFVLARIGDAALASAGFVLSQLYILVHLAVVRRRTTARTPSTSSPGSDDA